MKIVCKNKSKRIKCEYCKHRKMCEFLESIEEDRIDQERMKKNKKEKCMSCIWYREKENYCPFNKCAKERWNIW